MTIVMEKKYNPQQIEIPIYDFWKKSNYFAPDIIQKHKASYCIVVPPPNITGGLHLGHAFQQTIMDILVRFHRMKGKNTLWMVGFDHAGIATQILTENYIYKITRKTRQDYTKEFLLQQIWNQKKQSEHLISYQMERLGNSMDWNHKRFTMDSGFSFAVKEAFIRLYNDNLIYKGKGLVNWDYKLQTAISDLEVSYKQIQGFMWYIRYNLIEIHSNINNVQNYIVIATTRPETIFGDVAVAVNPNDSRYCNLIGKYVLVPIINRRIPIISDIHIDITKGTGCVKITPAHDFNDYNIGKKNKLLMINIFSVNRKILQNPEIFNSKGQPQKQLNYYIPKIFHNLDCEQARKLIVLECDKHNLLEDVKEYSLTIPYNSRTETVIEPMLTDQWYIRSKYLSKKAIYFVKQDIIEFIPKQYKNIYFKWMENIQDWCISRQIWWGHEIPAWYDDYNNIIYVGHSEKDIRSKNRLSNDIILRKDNDVLDTWFSSSLWTFSSLGWPVNTNLLNIFHPTDIIISGFDIIFFWIARMIMMTMYLIHNSQGEAQIPFKKVYITGLVRDELGQKMSKSKGNTLDPLDMIDGISIDNLLKKRTNDVTQPHLLKNIIKYTKRNFPNGIRPYGADALRLTLAALASSGRDIHWDIQKLIGYHNFCNKLWNVSRFILMHTVNQDCGISATEKLFSLPDQWISEKLNQTIKFFYKSLKDYKFDKIINILYEFIWRQFCDWYIEFAKSILCNEQNILKLRGTRYTLITSLEILLRLLHPIIPFITEKIWQEVKTIVNINGASIMLQPFPSYNDDIIDLSIINDIEWIKNVISEMRTLRLYTGVSHKIPLKALFICNSKKIKHRILENNLILIKMAHLKEINYAENNTDAYIQSIMIPLDESKLFIFIPNDFDKKTAIHRFRKEIDILNYKINSIQQKLDNFDYNNITNNGIIKEKEKLIFYNKIKNKLLDQYDMIKIL